MPSPDPSGSRALPELWGTTDTSEIPAQEASRSTDRVREMGGSSDRGGGEATHQIGVGHHRSYLPLLLRELGRTRRSLFGRALRFRADGREGDDLAKTRASRQDHGQPVDAEAEAARGGHAVLEGRQEVLVERVSLLVTTPALPELVL